MKKKKDKSLAFKDSLVNLVANIGTAKDKRTQSVFKYSEMARDELDAMYSSDWLSGKIVDAPADDMTRKWRSFNAPSLDDAKIDLVVEEEKKLNVKNKINEALKWSRLYGGCLVVMCLDDTGEYGEPLDVERVKKGALKSLLVIDRNEISIGNVNSTDLTKGNFREPEYYMLINGTKIHHSRVLRFEGIKGPWSIRQRENYWGISIIKRVYEAIQNSQATSNSISSLIYEATIDIVKIPELFTRLTQPNGEATVLARFQLADMLKSINNMLLLDSKEEHDRISTPFSGLPDLLIKYLNVAAAAADIPATRLLGQSAQGLNATGEGDLENYYDMISSKQETDLAPLLYKLDNVMVRSTLGNYPDDWSFYFNSLWQMSELEESDIQLKNSQRDNTYLGAGVITPSIVTKQLKQDEVYSSLDEDYIAALEQIEGEELDDNSADNNISNNDGNSNTDDEKEIEEDEVE